MKIVVRATNQQWTALADPGLPVAWIRVEDIAGFGKYPDAAAYFDLLEGVAASDHSFHSKPVFLNSVTATLKELQAPRHVMRINGWNGFIERSVWELAGEMHEDAAAVVEILQKKIIPVPDEPGLIAGRVISMIINEAYFALGEMVSSKAEIDTAMKLGTNYPMGPFEWAGQIGLERVKELLLKLSETDKRYLPAPALIAAANQST